MPFDLVAEVRCFFGRACGRARRRISGSRSTPMRVITVSCITTSRSVPGNMRPPIDEYSPSVFSRTTQKSMSPGLRPASGRRHAGHQPHRAQVDVLVELAPELDQRAPQRDVVRHRRRPADRAEEDRVVPADLLLPVLRHHAAVLRVVVAGGEVEVSSCTVEAVLLRRRLPARARPPARLPCRCRRRG